MKDKSTEIGELGDAINTKIFKGVCAKSKHVGKIHNRSMLWIERTASRVFHTIHANC